MNKNISWFLSKVITGEKRGRTFGYPTINLEEPAVMKNYKRGVYASKIKIDEIVYKGALYFGQKYISNQTKDVIEIFLFDFTGNLYNKTVKFIPVAFIRTPAKVQKVEELTRLIENDCKMARSLLQ